MNVFKPNEVRTYVINPEVKTVEQIVKFLSMIRISYGVSISLPPEMKQLIEEGIITEKTKANES